MEATQQIQSLAASERGRLTSGSDAAAMAAIVVAITLSSMPALLSGDKLNPNDDFLLFALRHEVVRKSLLEHHQFPLRSHWLGGGYPTLGEPEDPALNPLVLLSVLFGAVRGLKLMAFLATLLGGLSTYVLARRILGYTRWGALFSALTLGLSLFIPLRLDGGNFNEAYVAFFPLCLLLLGWACRGRPAAILVLSFLLYTMLSDGKLVFAMVVVYTGAICLLDAFPGFGTIAPRDSSRRVDTRPLRFLFLALGIAFLCGMMRILPMMEFMNTVGGWGGVQFHDRPAQGFGVYEGVGFGEFLGGLVAERKNLATWTIGWLPLILTGVALAASWRKTLPWLIMIVLFGWLILADNAPFDLYRSLRQLPVASAVRWPIKYFGFQVAYSFAIASGEPFRLLKRIRPAWLEHVIALVLVAGSLAFLYPPVKWLHEQPYQLAPPPRPTAQEEFFNVQGIGLMRNRVGPLRANGYCNLLHNIGTIDWFARFYIGEKAIPRFFVDRDNNYIANPLYRGEVYGEKSGTRAEVKIHPNSIFIEAHLEGPDTLVVNQNYHRDWRSSQGRLFDKDGLLALRLPKAGSYAIHLRYRPVSFYFGSIITILSLAGLAWVCWAYRTKRLSDWARRESPILKTAGGVGLWLIDGSER